MLKILISPPALFNPKYDFSLVFNQIIIYLLILRKIIINKTILLLDKLEVLQSLGRPAISVAYIRRGSLLPKELARRFNL